MAPVLAPEAFPPTGTTRAIPRLPATRRPAGGRRRVAALVAASGGLAAALGAAAWLVAAASERPSVLAPPTLRAPHRWLLGPLSGLLPGLSHGHVRLRQDLTIALVVLLAGWLIAWATAPALPVRAVAGAVGAAQLIFLLGPPQSLTDLFNYVVYGRMAADGVNPYTTLPVAGPHDAAYALANWHHLPSPYGPLFTLASEPIARLPLPVAYWTWKIVIVGCALGILAVVWWLAVRLGRSPQRALVCAGLCPVTLAVGLGGFHNDTPAILCVAAAAACLVRGRDAGADARWDAAAGVLAVVAAGIKPSFAVIAGIVVLGARRRPAALAGAAWSAAAVVMVVVLAFGGALPAVGIQGRIVTPLSLPNLLGVALGHGGADAGIRSAAHVALAIAVLAATAAVALRRERALPALGLVLLAAAAGLSWVMPWYLAWSLPFVALATPRALVPVAVVACLWLGIGGSPQLAPLIHDVGFYPTRSATGLANHDVEVELVR